MKPAPPLASALAPAPPSLALAPAPPSLALAPAPPSLALAPAPPSLALAPAPPFTWIARFVVLNCLVTLTLGIISSAGAVANATTVVFRCKNTTGEIQFADTPCRDRPSQELRIEQYSVFNTPIDSRNTKRLAEIDERLARERAIRATQKDQARRRQRSAAQQAAVACDRATQDLIQLKIRRRKGYALSDAPALAAREVQLLEIQRAYCTTQ